MWIEIFVKFSCLPLLKAFEQLSTPPIVAIVGITPFGGRLIPELMSFIEEAIEAGLDIVNGLNKFWEE